MTDDLVKKLLQKAQDASSNEIGRHEAVRFGVNIDGMALATFKHLAVKHKMTYKAFFEFLVFQACKNTPDTYDEESWKMAVDLAANPKLHTWVDANFSPDTYEIDVWLNIVKTKPPKGRLNREEHGQT